MTIVSHFELIFKPQSPASPPGVAVDRVIQGYFLEITNLEAVQLRFQLEFVAVPPAPATPNAQFRSLSGNTLVFVDTPGNDNQGGVLNGTPTSSSFFPSTGLITIAPQATALVAVLPSAFGSSPLDTTPLALPNFEVRGYVKISLPALIQGVGPFFLLRRVAQASAPVKVLLTPQNRATFITAANVISGQTQATLTVVGGSAQTVVPPDPGGPLRFEAIDIGAERIAIAELLQANPMISQPDVLATLLGEIDPNENLAPFNAALAEAGIGFAVEKRKPR